MEIIYLYSHSFKEISNSEISMIATIGAFDGLHLGHKMLIDLLNENSGNLKKMVITFNIHPDYSLNKRFDNGNLTSREAKEKFFEDNKIDYYVVLGEDILEYSFQEFNQKVLKKLHVSKVVVGKDFKYGKNKMGNIESLKRDFDVIECPLIVSNGQKMSSQRIREHLENGDVELIREILGENYKVSGIVQKGAGLGRKLGFPTANILLNSNNYMIMNGVYACFLRVENDPNTYLAVVNVGKNPTINTQKFPRIEAHIIDYNEDLYGKQIVLEFLKLIRKEIKFASVDDLICEINKNVEEVKRGFKK